ncbi:MAG: hypothetical protein FWC42_02610 [Proteobacteria bacterium]|nr:hypothetical protein [Pseudomonadota bacterium]
MRVALVNGKQRQQVGVDLAAPGQDVRKKHSRQQRQDNQPTPGQRAMAASVAGIVEGRFTRTGRVHRQSTRSR